MDGYTSSAFIVCVPRRVLELWQNALGFLPRTTLAIPTVKDEGYSLPLRQNAKAEDLSGESVTDPNAACYKKPDQTIDDNNLPVKCDLEE